MSIATVVRALKSHPVLLRKVAKVSARRKISMPDAVRLLLREVITPCAR